MPPETNSEEVESAALDEVQEMPRARDYFWRPWYAKAWWAGIPLYWLAIGDPTRPAFLNSFANSGYAFIAGMFFMPVPAILILGFGYFGKLLDNGTLGPYQPHYDIGFGPRLSGRPHPSVDELHPASPVYRYSLERQMRRD